MGKQSTVTGQNLPNLATRYSDEKLLIFKNLIQEELERKRKDLRMLKEGTNGTDDTSFPFKIIEHAQRVRDKEIDTKLVVRIEKYIEKLEHALIRTDNKTFGVCKTTGELIPEKRLRCCLVATETLDAKLNLVACPASIY